MDNVLAQVLADNALSLPERLLYATLHACTNGTGAGVMPVTELLARIGASSTAYLRRLRSSLDAAGYLRSNQVDDRIEWTLLAPVERANAPVERAADVSMLPLAALIAVGLAVGLSDSQLRASMPDDGLLIGGLLVGAILLPFLVRGRAGALLVVLAFVAVVVVILSGAL